MAYGRIHAPLVVALVATVASLAVEAANYAAYAYLLRSRRLRRIRAVSSRVTTLFQRWPFVTCLLAAATPVPDWSVRILGAFARYPMRRYLLAFAIGRVPKFWLLASVGQELQISRMTVVVMVLGSVVVTGAGVAVRQLRSARLVSLRRPGRCPRAFL
jgi:membrane protein YqaA with SNARE-associated domain